MVQKGDAAVSAPTQRRIGRLHRILLSLAVVAVACIWPIQRNGLLSWPSLLYPSSGRPLVRLPQGTVLGTALSNPNHPVSVEAFLGIPYALPPVGELRFARPVPVDSSDGILDASSYGPRCPGRQLISLGQGPDLCSEDCLTANVFRQSDVGNHGRTRVPVAVYMHGGAFNRGTARMHDTASMVAWSPEPFIAVSFNYRIGALGFLNSAATAAEKVLNVGLHDQILLLEWVKENIAAFGGDPDNVTVIGLSAGAHSIGHHVLSTKTKGQLFHKAVMESGGPTSRALHHHDSKLDEAQFQELLSETGCHDVPGEEVLSCLRAVSSDDIISASGNVFAKWNSAVRWAWQPVLDGEIIHRRPIDAWQSTNWHHVPILTGFNHNEGTMYVPKNLASADDFTQFFETLLPQLSASAVRKLEDLYPDPSTHSDSPYQENRPIQVGSQFKRVEAAYGHYAYVCPVRQTAQLARRSSPGEIDPPVYLYHWATNTTALGGANHGDQMRYETMDPLIRAATPSQHQISEHFHAYITSFILTGDPNAVRGRLPSRPEWHKYEEVGGQGGYGTMMFGEGNDERAGGNGSGMVARYADDTWARDECDFWWTQSSNYET